MMLFASWIVILAFEINVRCALLIGYGKTLPSLSDVRTKWSCDLHFDTRNCSEDVISARDDFLLSLPHFRTYRWILSLISLESESVLKDYLFVLGQFIFISSVGIFYNVLDGSNAFIDLFVMGIAASVSLLLPYVASAAGLFMPLAVFLVVLYDVFASITSMCVNLTLNHTRRFKKYVTRRKKDEKTKTKKIRLARQISVPPEWEDFDLNSTSTAANLVPLSKTHPEYQRIMSHYKSTGGMLSFSFHTPFDFTNKHTHTQVKERYNRSFKFKHPIYGSNMHTADL